VITSALDGCDLGPLLRTYSGRHESVRAPATSRVQRDLLKAILRQGGDAATSTCGAICGVAVSTEDGQLTGAVGVETEIGEPGI